MIVGGGWRRGRTSRRATQNAPDLRFLSGLWVAVKERARSDGCCFGINDGRAARLSVLLLEDASLFFFFCFDNTSF